MSGAMLERVAEQFRALGEPSRLRLMNLLFDGEQTVGELVEASGLSLANVSKHLGLLHQVGWVTRKKDGVRVVYALADERTFGLCELMCNRVRELAAAVAELAQPAKKRRR
jgi:DNA-binding transcriptional ArsR family regulator